MKKKQRRKASKTLKKTNTEFLKNAEDTATEKLAAKNRGPTWKYPKDYFTRVIPNKPADSSTAVKLLANSIWAKEKGSVFTNMQISKEIWREVLSLLLIITIWASYLNLRVINKL